MPNNLRLRRVYIKQAMSLSGFWSVMEVAITMLIDIDPEGVQVRGMYTSTNDTVIDMNAMI